MSELQAVRRLRPRVEPLDDATLERIWSDIATASADEQGVSQPTERGDAPRLQLDAPSGAATRSWILTAAAAALVVIGLGALAGVRALTEEPSPLAPAAQHSVENTSNSSPPLSSEAPDEDMIRPPAQNVEPAATLDQGALLLPAESVEPTYVQHNAALPHRTRGLISAPDGSTMSINLFENFWGELPAEMDQREIGGLRWATTLEDTRRGYVSLDDCTILSLNAGPGGTAWDDDAVALMNGVRFADSVTIDLPDGWQTIALGPVGEWYSMSFDSGMDSVPGVTLTQMPGSNAGPLLADFAGYPITNITIDGQPAWQIEHEDDGWTQTVWQNDRGAMMLLSKGLSPDRIADLLTRLTPATASDWDNRYHAQDVGTNTSMPDPVCDPATLLVNTSST